MAADARAAAEPVGTAVAAELAEIAERGVEDRNAAERIVAEVIDNHPILLKYAIGAQSPAERDAAKAQLASLVRRAALDALPPVMSVLSTPPESSATLTSRGTGAMPTSRENGATPTSGETGATPTSQKNSATRRPAADRPPAESGRRGAKAVKIAADGSPAKPARRHRAIAAGIAVLLMAGGLGTLLLSAGPIGSTIDDALGLSEGTSGPGTGAAPAPRPLPSALEPSTGEEAMAELRLTAPEPGAGAPGAGEPEVGQAKVGEFAAEPVVSASLPPVPPTTRLFVHYADGSGTGNEQAEALYATLSRDGGYPLVVLRRVNYTIATPRVRYFHADDAAVADRLADFLAPTAGFGDWQVQDFTSFRPQPAPGTIEIYVPRS